MGQKRQTISIAKIAEKLEDESMMTSAEGKPEFTSRTVENKFVKLIEAIGLEKKEIQNENKSYAIDVNVEAAISAILLDAATKGNVTNKIIKKRPEEIEPEDILQYFDKIFNYTEGKMDTEIRNEFLYE